MSESNDHICDLHSGIVDIVLNVDFPALKAQQAHERVAQNGIAKMSNMRSLVGINAGVLDQNLAVLEFRPALYDRRPGPQPSRRDLFSR